jgi:hypothetical protein
MSRFDYLMDYIDKETCGSNSSQQRRQLRRHAIEVGGETLPLVQALIEVR